MELRLAKYLLLLVMILWIQIHGSKGCFERERFSLLQFKALVRSIGSDAADHLLPSWVDNDSISNCCKWERVTCNSTSGHVIQLSLGNLQQRYNYWIYDDLDKIWFLNMSIFQQFSELRSLDLSFNNIGGFIHNEGFERLRSWNKLQVLDLSHNCFNNSILSSVGALKSLKTLFLRSNQIDGSFPSQELGNMENLQLLDLSSNELNSTPRFVGLKRLEKLYLNYNNLGGNLAGWLTNLTSLRFLDLSNNQFTGQIPSSWPSGLQSIDLSNNFFNVSFSFNSFGNCSSLEEVDLSDNEIQAEVKYQDWVSSFQLKVLIMQNCGLHHVPDFLLDQYRLELIDLSDNNLKGRFPNWLLENNTGLNILNFKNNSLYGKLQEIGEKRMPNIKYLNLARNHLDGDFPFSPSDDCKLIILDLSVNNFSGEIPEKLFSSCSYLESVKLSHNNFHGQIFKSQFNLTLLTYLELNDNQFMGTLSSLFFLTKFRDQFFGLEMVDLSNNRFHGEIPSWLCNFTNLISLNLKDNFFNGHLSCQLFSVGYLDLSYNSLSGSLPACFNRIEFHPYYFGNSLHINLQGNRLSGSIPKAFLNLSTLATLDLRDNNLSGKIPNNTFVAISNLRVLLLGGNSLNGSIPNWLCELNKISFLDLSRNSLSGYVPHCLENISFGRKVNLHSTFQNRVFTSRTIDGFQRESLILEKEILTYFDIEIFAQEEIEFVTKHMTYTYRGDILRYMSGLDLSHNELTGEIPFQLGKLSEIHALNLSHNQLIGSIPESFSNLTQLESLDLSRNQLSGEIPSNLINLNFLEVFSVSYNNLTGRIPEMKGQFSTFENSSYMGNPFLCGPPLDEHCTDGDNEPPSSSIELPKEAEDGKWNEIDHVVFFASFSVSFVMFFLGVITLLFVNPHWRQRLFYHGEKLVLSCYYFAYDTLSKLFSRLYH